MLVASGLAWAVVAATGVEQTSHGNQPPAAIVASFDGMGVGFEGPQGTAALRNPSDNSLAVGPDHIVQTVNSRMAVFTKKGSRFDARAASCRAPSTRTRSSRTSVAPAKPTTTATPWFVTTSSPGDG